MTQSVCPQVLLFLERVDYLRLVRAYEEKMLAATMDQLAKSQYIPPPA